MADKLSIGALSPDVVYDTLIKKGLTKSDAAVFVGEWLVGEFGQGQRSFNYVQTFDPTKPGCAPQFARSFAHRDWVDGEDVVQAGETAGEEGFNKRFHAIEKDLDALGRDAANVFACLAEMRGEIRNLLSEIRTELNRINSLLDKRSSGTTPPFTTFPGVIGTGTLLGSIKFNDKAMTLWNTAQGMIMLPAASVINPNPLEDPRTINPGNLAKFIAERADVRRRFPGAMTKKDFVETFGRERVEDGTFVRELLESIPQDSQFANLDAMMNDLVEREAAALRTTQGIEAIVFSAYGVDLKTQKAGEAPLDKFEAIPQFARVALIRNGIDTVGKLSEAGPARLQEVFRSEQILDVTVATTAGWVAQAKTLARL